MALFKIYNNIDSNNPLPAEHHKGYMYFDATTKLFYIDVADDEYDGAGNLIETTEQKRFPLNSWGAMNAYADSEGSEFTTTYAKKTDIQNATMHTLTFGDGGQYVYDGSEDVTVPVYTGEYTQF